eukprot:TRINITY_DN70206_c0_g1_i1.p2 TRINITY_DN70206_c0_g1~~TRINITY_DN70206_c0_g1_i1.p2  ORF type:complete len:132 (-),score=13.18 TRINITY_DN70206_c0_g1_i1:552-947(-)
MASGPKKTFNNAGKYMQITRYDRSRLLEGVDDFQKITMTSDSRLPNCCEFVLYKEDHSLANLLRMCLLYDTDVIFAGYRVPHPLNPEVVLKIQTREVITPQQALRRAVERLIRECDNIERQLTDQQLPETS